MESSLGWIEYELCDFLKVTPKGLGKLREEDPLGIAFLERHLIHRLNKEQEAVKKREREMKSKSRKRAR